MKTPVEARLAALIAVVPMILSGQMLRDNVPLRRWPAPLYWQPDLAGPAATPADPNALTFIAMTPCRVVDTRGNGYSGAFGPPSLVGGMGRAFPHAIQHNVLHSGNCPSVFAEHHGGAARFTGLYNLVAHGPAPAIGIDAE